MENMKNRKLLAECIALGLILSLPCGMAHAETVTYDGSWYKQDFTDISEKDLEFTNASVNLDSSTIKGANNISFAGKLSLYGTNAEISGVGKLVTGGKLSNTGTIQVGTLGDESHRSEVFNMENYSIAVTDKAVIGNLTNNGTFTAGSLDIVTTADNGIENKGALTVTDTITVDAGSRGIQNTGTITADIIQLRDKLENKEGGTVKANEITADYFSNAGTITGTDGGAIGKVTATTVENHSTLEVTDFNVSENINNYGSLTVDKIGTEATHAGQVNNKGGATLNVSGDVYAGLANGGSMTIEGNFTGSGYLYEGSSFTAKDAELTGYTQIDAGATSFTVDNLNIANEETRIFVDTENFHVNDTVRVDGYLYFRENSGEVSLNKVQLNNAIQVSGNSLHVNQMTVENGSLSTYDLNNTDNDKQITVGALSVEEDGRLTTTNQAGDGSRVEVGSLALGDGATLSNIATHVGEENETSAFTNFNVTSMEGNHSILVNEGKMSIGTLSGEGNTIEVHSLEDGQVSIGNNTSTGLQVTGTSAATDQFDSNDLAGSLQSLADTVSIESGSQLDSVLAQEGKIFGEITAGVDENGHIITGSVVEKGNLANEGITELANVALMSWRADNDEMHQRMGELRSSRGEAGVWARMKRGESESGDLGIKNQYNTYQLGYDRKVGDWFVGGAVSRTEGESRFDTGSGENKATGFTLYGTRVSEDGQYVDISAKYARLDNEFDVWGRGGIPSSGDYSNNGYAFSAEYGKRFEVGSDFWIEPQVELTYGHLSSADYTTSRGVHAEQDAMDSVVGRVGFAAGRDIRAGNVYVKASYLYDFDGETSVHMTDGLNSADYSQDLGGSWFEFGLGANLNLSDTSHLYVDLERAVGGDVGTPWQWTAGLRFDF